ncbi:MAG: SulP family inorganic anion transporter [Chloroflexota bacterium]|nr:SulP family inorganic anion transporter [Chloroflexota bacterium]
MQISFKSIKRYFRRKFRADFSTGLTIAMVAIPQSMAYAAIAGVNPIYGLYTAIIPTIVGALFGSFPYLVTGPTNPTALVTASVLLGFVDKANYLEYVLTLSILAGLFKLLLGLFKLGSLTRYISNSVLVGFLSAAGVLIIGGQLGNLLGVTLSKSSGLRGILRSLVGSLSQIHPPTLLISLGAFALMLTIRAVNRKLPAALITIVAASLGVYLTGWGGEGVRLVSSYGLPSNPGLSFHLPNITFNDIGSLLVPGAAVAVFGLMEAVSITKAMSQLTGDRLDPSREMIGQGLASLVGGLFYCMPSSGSPSRTVINVVNGGRTRLSAVISGFSVLIFLLLFSGLIGYIPLPALAAVVVVSSAGLINVSLIKLTWESHTQSRVGMLITFASTLILPLEYAIFLGMLSTILIFLSESSHVNLTYIIEEDDGQFVELPIDRLTKREPEIAIVNVEGDLYFAAVEAWQDQIETILDSGLKVLILRFRRTHLLASTGVMALDQIIRQAEEKGISVLFCGMHEEIEEPLESAGILNTIGSSQIFNAHDQIFDSAQSALERAKEILSQKHQSPNKETNA